VKGVDGKDGFGTGTVDGFEDGEEALLLFGGRDRGGAGASGFGAEVEDVDAGIKEFEGVGEGI